MSSQKTTQTSTQTMTPNNPQWVTDTIQGLSGNINSLAGQNPKSFFAGPTGLTQTQFDLTSALTPTVSSWLNDAGNLAKWADDGYTASLMQAANTDAAQAAPASHATASTAADNMGAYYNPYQQQVVDSTLSTLDKARQLAQNTSGQGAILAGQYGGSRQGVLDRTANQDFLKQVGDTTGQLNYQGFNTAAQLGAGDADRLTNTSQFNAGQDNTLAALNAQLQQQANLANAGYQQEAAAANQGATNNASQFNLQNMLNSAGLLGQLGQTGVGLLSDSAQTQQGLAQQQAQAPLSVLQLLSGAAGSLPYGLFQGNTTTGTGTVKQSGGLLGQLGGLAMGIGGLGSGLGSLGVKL